MRDRNDNVVIVCSIENVDPMGVHTGDSVTVAPAADAHRPPLPAAARPGDRRHPRRRRRDRRLERAVRGQPGDRGDPRHRDEPARVALLGAGVEGDGLPDREDRRPARGRLRARGDPQRHHAGSRRRASSRRSTTSSSSGRGSRSRSSPASDPELTTHMKSVGEAMAIGRTFQQAFAKAMRSPRARQRRRPSPRSTATRCSTALERPAADRYDAPARGVPARARRSRRSTRARASTRGSCASCASSRSTPTRRSRGERSFKAVDTCAAEFAARDAVLLLGLGARARRTRSSAATAPSVVILGSGPNRIGQGIEFDYCCVHAAMTVRESGRDAVMVNCNPETVSTDYDTSDRLYFEPLTLEDVLGVVEVEQPEGVIVQFGGQTPLKLAAGLVEAGRAAARHERRGDRPRRGPRALRRAARRASATRRRRTRPRTRSRRRSSARRDVGFPLLVRPSYVLGGRAMEIVYSTDGLRDYLERNAPASNGPREIFLDRFLEDAIEVDVDALCDGEDVWIGGIMQHVEEAGIHSGDSRLRAAAALARPRDARPRSASRRRASRSGSASSGCSTSSSRSTRGELYVIEANPRASRTVPFVSQGDRDAAGQARLPDHARRAARRPRPARRPDALRPRLGQGGGAAVRPLRGRRRAARPGDALDRRGDGRRARLPDRLRQGAGRRRRRAARDRAPRSSPSPTATSRAPSRSPQTLHDLGFRIVATRGTAEAIERMGIPAERAQQDRRGLAARRRLDRARRRRPRRQHADRLAARAPTAGRSAAPPSRAASRASRRCRAALAAARAIARRARSGAPEVLSLQELHRGRARRARPPA